MKQNSKKDAKTASRIARESLSKRYIEKRLAELEEISFSRELLEIFLTEARSYSCSGREDNFLNHLEKLLPAIPSYPEALDDLIQSGSLDEKVTQALKTRPTRSQAPELCINSDKNFIRETLDFFNDPEQQTSEKQRKVLDKFAKFLATNQEQQGQNENPQLSILTENLDEQSKLNHEKSGPDSSPRSPSKSPVKLTKIFDSSKCCAIS